MALFKSTKNAEQKNLHLVKQGYDRRVILFAASRHGRSRVSLDFNAISSSCSPSSGISSLSSLTPRPSVSNVVEKFYRSHMKELGRGIPVTHPTRVPSDTTEPRKMQQE